MRFPRLRFTVRRMMVAVAVVAVFLAARHHAMEAYDTYRFHRWWNTRDVTGEVTGEVTAVVRSEGRVTISIGSDDGFGLGEVLFLFREAPDVRYIGKVRMISLEYESAKGQIVSCVHGLAIRAGDRVAHFNGKSRTRRMCVPP
jgi:hypothetical protein